MTFLVVPEDFVIVSKLGGTMFILFVSGIIFLAIELITFFSNKLRKLLISRQNKKYLNRIKESEYQEVLESGFYVGFRSGVIKKFFEEWKSALYP